jgi:hypothetical protein
LDSELQSWIEDSAPNIIVAGVALHDMAALVTSEEYQATMQEVEAKAGTLMNEVV